MALDFNIFQLDQGFQKEVATARKLGIKEAAKIWADELYAKVDKEKISQTAKKLIALKAIRGNDARAAYNLYQAYIESLFPATAWAAWKVLRRLLGVKPPHIFTADKVVFYTPLPSGCPMVRACSGDMDLCEALCRENFKYWAFNHPGPLLSIKEINPNIRWKLHRFRQKPRKSCEYAIVNNYSNDLDEAATLK